MKRILVIFAFGVLAASSLFGCSSDKGFKDEADLISVSGIIQEQVAGGDFAGTHILDLGDGLVKAVRSLSINLSDSLYLNNRVELLGFYNPADSVFEATGISILEVLSNARIDGVKFVPLEDAKLGFRIKYYDDWTVAETDNAISFSSIGNEETVIVSREKFEFTSVLKEDGSMTTALEEYFNLSRDGQKIEDVASILSEIGVDKLSAVKLENENGGVVFYLYRPDYIYLISYDSQLETAKYSKIFAEMTGEFQFIPFGGDESNFDKSGDEVLGVNAGDQQHEDFTGLLDLDFEFTTFESLPYSFRGQYPKSWYYAGSKNSDSAVLHHYGFSDEPVENENQIISLDVISGDIPGGKTFNFADKELLPIDEGEEFKIFTRVGDYNYRVVGPRDYKSLIIYMAARITPVEGADLELSKSP